MTTPPPLPPGFLDFDKKLFSSLLHLPRDTAGIRICCPAICLLFPASPGDGGQTRWQFGEVKGNGEFLHQLTESVEKKRYPLIEAAICKQNLLSSHKRVEVGSFLQGKGLFTSHHQSLPHNSPQASLCQHFFLSQKKNQKFSRSDNSQQLISQQSYGWRPAVLSLLIKLLPSDSLSDILQKYSQHMLPQNGPADI